MTDQAVDYIRDAITSGELVAGQTYSAAHLGALIGVSRTPIREALLQLASAGMIRIDTNKGAVVLGTRLPDLIEVFQIRLMLELPATARAADAATPEVVAQVQAAFSDMQAAADADDQDRVIKTDRAFHQVIIRQAGNQRLEEVLAGVRNLVLTRDDRSPQDVVADHRGILQGFVDRDGGAAAAAMRQHILTTARLLTAQLAAKDPRYTISAEQLEDALSWPLYASVHGTSIRSGPQGSLGRPARSNGVHRHVRVSEREDGQ